MSDSSWWQRLSSLGRCLAVTVTCGVVVCIALSIAIGLLLSNEKTCSTETVQLPENSTVPLDLDVFPIVSNVCETPNCIHAASRIINDMNASANPCDDFYQYACGGFLEQITIPDDQSHVNKFTLTLLHIQNQLREAIEEPREPDGRKVTKLVKNLYTSCMDEKTIREQGVAPLVAILKELGGWPVLEGDSWNETEFHWMESVYKFREMGLPTNFFIGFRIDIDLTDTNAKTIYIDQASLGLLKEYLTEGVSEEILAAYQKYIIDVAVLLGASNEVAEKELAESLQFEKELAQISITTVQRNSINRIYNPMTIKQMSSEYPSIPWKEYMNKLMAPKASVDDDEIVIVHVPEYIKNFEKLIETTPARVQANYVIWRAAAELVKFLSDDIRSIHLEFDTKLFGVAAGETRWEECIRIASDHLSFAVGSMYVRGYFREDAKNNALQIFQMIKNEFDTILKEAEWMDSGTREKALRKATGTMPFIGYPDELMNDEILEEYYQNLELSGDSYLESMLNLTRFKAEYAIEGLRKPYNGSHWMERGDVTGVVPSYNLIRNNIGIPASVLQEPFYDADHPKYINYGSIGFIIGHEMAHGYYSRGRYFDGHGYVDLWWSPTTEKNFEHRTECIVNQYNNYIEPQTGLPVNGASTCTENVADAAGVRVAYSAYSKWASENSEEKSLPGLDYTPQQLFWLSMANVWCSKSRPAFLRYKIVESKYSPSSFRVLGTVSNMAEFAKDFKCSEGTQMNPKTKCVIW